MSQIPPPPQIHQIANQAPAAPGSYAATPEIAPIGLHPGWKTAYASYNPEWATQLKITQAREKQLAFAVGMLYGGSNGALQLGNHSQPQHPSGIQPGWNVDIRCQGEYQQGYLALQLPPIGPGPGGNSYVDNPNQHFGKGEPPADPVAPRLNGGYGSGRRFGYPTPPLSDIVDMGQPAGAQAGCPPGTEMARPQPAKDEAANPQRNQLFPPSAPPPMSGQDGPSMMRTNDDPWMVARLDPVRLFLEQQQGDAAGVGESGEPMNRGQQPVDFNMDISFPEFDRIGSLGGATGGE
jgi:hypothetical protein